ncbi:MAG: phosphoribosylglycinamide formyltransferase [Pseudomarimonas sp.]
MRVAVLASGVGSNFAALLEASRDGRLPITMVGVFSDRPQAPVLSRARAADIHAQAFSPRDYATRDAHEAALFAAVDAVQPDLIVCAGYMRIFGSAALLGRSQKMLNIHPSLLPKHRGLHTHQRALEAGDARHGASVHFVTAELDGGPVIAQAQVNVRADDSVETLADRVRLREHPLLCATVGVFAQGRLALRDGVAQLDGKPIRSPLLLNTEGRLMDSKQ